MENNNMICVSVRMTREEYMALQMMAKQDFTTMSGHTPQTVAGCRRKGVISMKSKMTMLNRQRQLMGVCGS